MSEIVTMSSKGQIVVPKDLREQLRIDTGAHFAIFGKDDTLVLKRVKTPSPKEVFEILNTWGTKLAKQKGWKEEELIDNIHKARRVKSV
jgi:AbrB family looped-hinge helix DNA binding protein